MSYRQTETPPMGATEKGRFLCPEYDTALITFDVTPTEWKHLCSCRFGEARGSSTCKWSGDCYRYDIFETGEGYGRKIALRWWNGSGEGWLTDMDREGVHLLRHIVGIENEPSRWDFCHKLWLTAIKSALASARSERQMMFEAFCEGRMKKRKKGNSYTMEIKPK